MKKYVKASSKSEIFRQAVADQAKQERDYANQNKYLIGEVISASASLSELLEKAESRKNSYFTSTEWDILCEARDVLHEYLEDVI